MPWIHVTLPDVCNELDRLAQDLAQVAAKTLGLAPADVVVLLTIAKASAGHGATVAITGRRRADGEEAALADAVRSVVASGAAIEGDLVAVVRS